MDIEVKYKMLPNGQLAYYPTIEGRKLDTRTFDTITEAREHGEKQSKDFKETIELRKRIREGNRI